jgi:hypothetical protein
MLVLGKILTKDFNVRFKGKVKKKNADSSPSPIYTTSPISMTPKPTPTRVWSPLIPCQSSSTFWQYFLPVATYSPSCEAPCPGAEWSCCSSSTGRWRSPPWLPIQPKPQPPSVSEQNLEGKLNDLNLQRIYSRCLAIGDESELIQRGNNIILILSYLLIISKFVTA